MIGFLNASGIRFSAFGLSELLIWFCGGIDRIENWLCLRYLFIYLFSEYSLHTEIIGWITIDQIFKLYFIGFINVFAVRFTPIKCSNFQWTNTVSLVPFDCSYGVKH